MQQRSTQQAAQRRRAEGVYSDRDLVFANALGRPLQVSTVHRWVKAAFERPGLPLLGECPIEPRIAEGDSQLTWVH